MQPNGHWHMIYTPKTLLDFSAHSVSGITFWSASAELGQGGRHWHIYMETLDDESTIRDKLKRVQNIPTGQRGKKSLHYSLRPVLKSNPEYPDEDLQLFTLGYTLKNQDPDNWNERDHMHSGYSQEHLKKAHDYYHERTNHRYKPPVVDQEAIDKVMNAPQGIQAEWADFTTYFEVQLKKITISNAQIIPTDFFKSHSRKFWRACNNNLLPQSSKYKRFLASIADMYRARLRVDDRLQLMKECGY